MIFGRLDSSEQLSTERDLRLEGYIRIEGDFERPSPMHVCNIHGIWILPTLTKQEVAQIRKKLYEQNTDDLLREIEADRLLGKDTRQKIAEFKIKVLKIKVDNPYPKQKLATSHYQPLIHSVLK